MVMVVMISGRWWWWWWSVVSGGGGPEARAKDRCKGGPFISDGCPPSALAKLQLEMALTLVSCLLLNSRHIHACLLGSQAVDENLFFTSDSTKGNGRFDRQSSRRKCHLLHRGRRKAELLRASHQSAARSLSVEVRTGILSFPRAKLCLLMCCPLSCPLSFRHNHLTKTHNATGPTLRNHFCGKAALSEQTSERACCHGIGSSDESGGQFSPTELAPRQSPGPASDSCIALSHERHSLTVRQCSEKLSRADPGSSVSSSTRGVLVSLIL